ncbi:MAG: phenylacetate--CoA ligase [Candidatus Delongbacteria bacterium]|nr:phenylacetate--CoA ligase [Candidatus Delongbacteria bacterium]
MKGERMFWNQTVECMSQDEIRAVQFARLKTMISYLMETSPIMPERFRQCGFAVEDLKSPDDLRHLPMISKEEFRLYYPIGMCCVKPERLREMHMSSGSTGTPVVMPYTENDLQQWADCMARCYRMAGVPENAAIQITPSFGLFNGGFGFYHGARKAGLFIIPTGAGNTPRQIKLMKDFSVVALMGVVSYGIRIMEELDEMKQSLPNLKIGMFGAESFSQALKVKLEKGLGIEAFDIYGMTETGGVGTVGMDCPEHNGLHVWEDQYMVEVVDPVTHQVLPDGQLGEVVFTSLTREALPVFRFRTGDLSRIISREKCACGRTHARLECITGRIDDMLIVKGVNFFPRQVEETLMKIPGVLHNYQIIIEETDGIKDVRINVEVEEGVTGFTVEKALKESLGFSPKGDVFRPGELPRNEGKAIRVIYEKK